MLYKFRRFERFDKPQSDNIDEVYEYLRNQLNEMVDDLNGGNSTPGELVGRFYNEKDNGTAGDTATANSWNTRVIDRSFGPFSVQGSQILLPKGEYEVDGWSIATGGVATHQTRVYNISDGSTLVLGGSVDSASSKSTLDGSFNITSDKRIEFQHFVQSAGAFGVATGGSNNTEKELYAQLTIRKVS